MGLTTLYHRFTSSYVLSVETFKYICIVFHKLSLKSRNFLDALSDNVWTSIFLRVNVMSLDGHVNKNNWTQI